MRLVPSKDVFSSMESSVERLQDAESEEGRERILLTQNISSAVSHWVIPRYGMDIVDIGEAAMKTIILCHDQQVVQQKTKEEMDASKQQFTENSYTTLNQVVKELSQIEVTLKPEDKVADLTQVIEKEKLNSLNSEQINKLIVKLENNFLSVF